MESDFRMPSEESKDLSTLSVAGSRPLFGRIELLLFK